MPAEDSFKGLERRTKSSTPHLVLEPLHLVAERRLGDVQKVGGAREPARVVDRADRASGGGTRCAYAAAHNGDEEYEFVSSPRHGTRAVGRSYPMPAPRISFEFFPPQSLDASFRLWETVRMLAPLSPGFVSVTYGAGGTTRQLTHEAVARPSGALRPQRRGAPHLRERHEGGDAGDRAAATPRPA
jgi:hypothetical protein